ncbi:AAA family ATPase [Arthrobacter bambusae]|uniref:ATP-dependent Clp protease ATP-binding subunit ClpA n=1 Tax=Arthrobacter bambusae TaxID=1338426 RepID=A0AAW8D972_9MICC|nr:AAA family ATPase [Arthrobacter bambusae]MDP9903184.1 ATP-dependent Clp protease ATP-binding subunit ClpA [Arthrobacter bambusae]MDQ0128822.1 ATP-dependent Clp protease ATP-binding subunit ClpA [Arthrobacter bambusae]MDQ0180163.1 ATP-dependent Clp protease ATP-binding subunit ClpA [Arthrobacter bambusae]
MGLTNFTSDTDDDQTGSGPLGSGHGGTSGNVNVPAMPPMPGPGSDIHELLINYNDRFKNATPALFRDKLIEQTLAVLIRKDKPNPLIVGPAGVGKTRIVEEIARMIAIDHPTVPTALQGKIVYELPMASLVAGAGIVGQLEQRVTDLVNFAIDPSNNAVLFIDEIHVLAESENQTYQKIAQILKPALARGDMHVIGATTAQEARAFDDDPAFQRRFSRLIVDELTREQTIEILRSANASYMAHHNYRVLVSDEMLVLVAAIADELGKASQHRPDNAVTLLDQTLADVVVAHGAAIARAQQAGDQAIVQALQGMTNLSLTEQKIRGVALRLASGVAEKAPYNEQALRDSLSSMYGQDEVLEELLEALRRDQLGAFARTRPMAWMLAGPSGVGKTETVKRISQHLTGQAPIMLNMGDYSNEHDISKLNGSGPGYVGSQSNKELPFDTLESNPYRVILLDEIEKAHRSVHRLLLTALDEGWMRMSDGKIIDFSKVTIIATTNAAREIMGRPSIGFSVCSNAAARPDKQSLVKALKEHFDAEFLGRFQQIIAYAPITRDVYAQILNNAYGRERNRLLAENPRLGMMVPSLDASVLAATVDVTYLVEQGARPAERAARELIEDSIIASQQQHFANLAGEPNSANSNSENHSEDVAASPEPTQSAEAHDETSTTH